MRLRKEFNELKSLLNRSGVIDSDDNRVKVYVDALQNQVIALTRIVRIYETRVKSVEKYLGIEYVTETTESFHKKIKGAKK